MRRLFMIGGVMSVVSIRLYKPWKTYDPKDMDNIVELSIYVD